eukprot:TRINITY_DN15734_c0_g1_i1.p1 TRINITY_DN15734_c0_g1~~TRINITY_DN15734_c0_g1_i1.p1  ORF type:complete len:526 (+),score=86.50 TRINITY_DN15734_c0_g1_i1:34-1578(+)
MAPEGGSSLIGTIFKVSCFIVFLVLFLYVLTVAIISPMLFVQYNQALVDATLNSGDVTMDWTVVYPQPIGDTIWILTEANVTFTQTGPLEAKLKAANFTVMWEGQLIGYMLTPENDFPGGNKPVTFHQFTNLTILNVAAYREQASIVANGGQISWRFEGDVKASIEQYGFTLDFDVYMSKDVTITGRAPFNMTSFGIEPLSGTNDTLVSVSTQTFINPSNIGLMGFGDITLDIYSEDGIFIGNGFVDDFNLYIGKNVQNNVRSTAVLTETSRPAIEKMFSKWGMGISQKLRAVGPVSSSLGFYPLYNTSDQWVTVAPNTQPLIQQVYLGAGGSAGIMQTLVNPVNVEVSSSEIIFKTEIPRLSNGALVAFKLSKTFQRESCPATTDGPILTYSTPEYPLILEPLGVANYTMGTATPNNCQNFIPLAICCGFANGTFASPNSFFPPIPLGTNTFSVSAAGSTLIKIFDFAFNQVYSQEDIPTYCLLESYTPVSCNLYFDTICMVGFPGQTVDDCS